MIDHNYWYSLGIADGSRSKATRFRMATRNDPQYRCKGERPEDWTDDDEDAAGCAYMEGYDDAPSLY